MRPRPFSLLLTIWFMTAAAAARADAEADAKDLFAHAREMRAHGDCGGAAPIFRRAWAIFPKGLGSLRNLAECEQSLGHHASARRAWLDLSRALLVEHDPKYAGWDDEAKSNAAELGGKVASLRVVVTTHGADGEGPATASSPIRVTVNGEVLPLELLGAPLDRDPGSYRVLVEGDRVERPIEQSVDLAPGRAETLAIVVKLKPALDAQHVPPTSGVPSTRSSPALLWGGVALAGAGVLAGAGSAIAFGARQGALADVQRSCPSLTGCDPALGATVSRGQTASAASTALLIAALVSAGLGVTMIVLSPSVRVRVGAAAVTVEGKL